MKLLIFTEHKDTLDYLAADGKEGRPLGKLRQWGLSVTQIHGGMKIGDRDTPGTRIYAEKEFRDEAQVLVATEAAGEGINLQFCWFMINYDIPWNPVRLEQRMGRIHRYGQEKDCLILNFVATNTREGRVLQKLFQRLEQIEEDLDPHHTGKIFNVLGDIFPANQLEKDGPRHVRPQPHRRRHQEPHRRERRCRAVPADHQFDPGRPGQAGVEPLGPDRQVGRGPRAPPGARGHRGLLHPGRAAGRGPSQGDEAEVATSTGSAASRAPCSPSATGWNPDSASWAASTGRSSSTRRSWRRTPRRNGSRPAIRCLRPSERM